MTTTPPSPLVDFGRQDMPTQDAEIALCPVELSNVALRMAPRMHQNMQSETQKFKKNPRRGTALSPDPSFNAPHPIPIVSAPLPWCLRRSTLSSKSKSWILPLTKPPPPSYDKSISYVLRDCNDHKILCTNVTKRASCLPLFFSRAPSYFHII